MAEEWTTVTVDGVDYWEIGTTRFRVPVDWVPGSKMFIAVAASEGSGNFPAAIQGDPGDPPTIDTTINLTALAADDADPDAASWTETSPDTYQLNLTLHKGPKGDDGDTVLTLSDFGTPAAKKILVVNTNADDLEYQTQLCGDRYIPATIASTPSGNASYTLASVSVPAQGFAWRPDVSGQTIVTGTGADVRVDLIARLDDATSGNVVGRAYGIAGVGPAWMQLSSGPPAASASAYDTVSAGSTAVIYLRVERQSGSATFTTSASTTSFCVRVRPIP